MLTIQECRTTAERRAFVTFPWRVYRNDPHWVPPLISERMAFFDPQRNPFYQHAEVALFMARRDGEPVGTIAALINHQHNAFHNEQVGFFGAFEVLPDREAAHALLATARDWVRERGMTALRGPATFSTNEECGLLIEGFDDPPRILMAYNPPYYRDFIERFGFQKAMDLYAYELTVEVFNWPEKLVRVVEKLKSRAKFRVRPGNIRRFREELDRIKKVYNSAWERNWGFVPLTDAEIEHMAAQLIRFVDPDLVFIAEVDDEPIGFSLTLPDLNQALRKAYPRPGVPEWWTLIKLLYYWKVRRVVDTIRVLAMGVVESWRAQGVSALFYYETAKAALPKGYRRAEMSWILENNLMMNRDIRTMGGRLYKIYRMYELPL
ncbi:MAG: GNAT family N-acetyltransferase [Thermoflexus hugenholtzii]|jgi:GNAT superfamily N-acetyltransferase|uniref:GNAT family N-acetyltransferase n=1 Tax=Thermoflexus TaxID=1495649 RepID=UPI001C76BE16|nr:MULTISPECIES: GNAT family N-acetyltransferase [Thermoflexus]QWK10606.1 MAG: GNAT family N-acetyltransferase [Thermoflexus hugenholtzii]